MEGFEGSTKYLLEREKWWASFKARYEGHLRARLRGVLDDVAEDDVWLHEAEPLDPSLGEVGPWTRIGEHLAELFRAYRELRFDHQIQYADFKLDKGGRFFASAVRQHEILRGLSLGCILIIFLAHILIAFSLVSDWGDVSESPWIEVGVLWFVIIVLGARAFEEGLQPTREGIHDTLQLCDALRRFSNALRSRPKKSALCARPSA
jgi:hypothetical protein